MKQSIGWNTRKKAGFPRIIIDDMLKPAEFLIEIERDENKTYYLNCYKLGYELFKHYSNIEFKTYIQNHQAVIKKALFKYKYDERIFKKYIRLANLFNKFCADNDCKQFIISWI